MKCTYCSGDGWYVEHDPYCGGWESGNCDCQGVQIQCAKCEGTGEV